MLKGERLSVYIERRSIATIQALSLMAVTSQTGDYIF